MTAILLTPRDLAVAALLVLVDIGLSVWLRLGLHRQLAIAAVRLVVQLVLVGHILRAVFAAHHPAVTLLVVAVMTLVASREVASRPDQRLAGLGNHAIAFTVVGAVTGTTAMLALATAIRPHPLLDPRYAIPLAGIILGSVLNAGSVALDSMLAGASGERGAIEARLALGTPMREALRPLTRRAVRLGLLPVINQMSAAGIITLPGIMTGQILAGMDPVEAVKYQMLLMLLLAGASGLTALGMAWGAARLLSDPRQRLRLDRLDGPRG